LFYYSPDMPKIHLKQSWMTLNHIEKTYGGAEYSKIQIDPLMSSKYSLPIDIPFTITNNVPEKKPSNISNEFLKEYCGNSHSKYYDDFCIASGRGAAWNVNLGIQNGKSKYKNEGREELFQKLLRTGLDQNWESARNFSDAMNYLKTSFSGIFNQNDPYYGTLGVYSKKYYMKDVT
jgi:hypothetical protein